MLTWTVWKFPLQLVDRQTIDMPSGAELLHAAAQFDHVTLWARVNPDAALAARTFVIVGTGNPAPPLGRYVGTAIMRGGEFVWHVFEDVMP